MFRQLLLLCLLAFALTQDPLCPNKLLIECEQDAEKAFAECDKAAKEKGGDQTADINCIKFLLSAKKDCWPCICEIAKKQHWKVRGCELIKHLFDNIKANLQDEK